MIGIKNIASYIPVGRIDNLAQAASFDRSEAFVMAKVGTASLPVKRADEETSDLCVAAIHNLLEQNTDLRAERIEALVVVTQNGDGEGLPHTSAIVQHKLGLPVQTACFDISLGCSGFVYGLYVLAGFMQAMNLKNAVLVTADPYSKHINHSDRATTLLFGDAATATWVGENPTWKLGPARFGTDGGGAEHLVRRDGLFHMNGRNVLEFASARIAPQIEEVLELAGLTLDMVDRVLLHQGSATIIDLLSRNLGANGHKVIKDLSGVGNTVSSSIPLLMARHAAESSWNNLVISGFGVGLSWGSAVLQRN
ncbi:MULTISPECIES: ketoacyl-ACP synthase III [Pseudomonas]|uniref:Ketoacyl-ACP synthase III n=1 Tax=Pseudomonas helleri TaxID=1608996 RepID=A0A6L5HSW8_9PSED|nr:MULTISPECIES: ketoacyl-ACP synthase III [Pseudomonas]MQT47874.1 ketoacyl-ACP synthase III [Pseudomonas helleri]MQT59177.1 ketoacyl-ACP synthase III [Pseudomonas sp. FSL R10-0399]MQT88757.1 ketoacyl-ACP synthase III [Pseudomonas helleri]MQU06429.1 ketoacyl-ACP synthase III [Pseudomonas helleri]